MQTADRVGFCQQLFSCFLCNGSSYAGKSKRSHYSGILRTPSIRRDATIEEDVELTESCCKVGTGEVGRMEAMVDLERADCNIELARIRVADGNLKIARSTNYIKVIQVIFISIRFKFDLTFKNGNS